MSLLEIEKLTLTIGATPILRGVDLSVAPGEIMGLVGESGSGKSMTALAARRLRRIDVALVLAGINVWPLVLSNVPLAAAAPGPTVRVMSANLLGGTLDEAAFRRAVAEVKPDILVVQEASGSWRKVLEDLPGLPYRASQQLRFVAGVDVLSRTPLNARMLREVPYRVGVFGGGIPLRVTLSLDALKGRPVVIYAVHPPTPRTEAGWMARNRYLDGIALPDALRYDADLGVALAHGAADDAVRPAETRLEDVVDAVVLRMGRGGEVTEAAGRVRPLLKLAPELLAGNGLFERVHVADRLAYLSALADMREGAASRRLELRIRLPRTQAHTAGDNYRPFSLEFLAAGVEAEAGGFVAVLRENDEMVDMREALVAAREAAASAEVAKGRFLAAVSHELRTPLNAIIGFSDMLLNEMCGSFGNPRQKEYVGLVRDSGQHLLEVVTSILDVSRMEAGAYSAEPEPFRFAEAVEMCRAMMAVQADARQVELTAHVAPDCGEINADRRAVQQILINLASNAIKFTPEGGKVAIGAQRVGSRLHFWVSDTGIGIAEEDLDKLGKPFMQIQNDYTRRFQGAGLGLSLVKGLVALHEGTMSVESAPGQGTKVTVSLPVDGPKGGPKQPRDKSVILPMLPAQQGAAAGVGKARKETGHGPFRKTA